VTETECRERCPDADRLINSQVFKGNEVNRLVQSAQVGLLTISLNGATLLRMNVCVLFPKKGDKRSP
jgi:hypothetical protein